MFLKGSQFLIIIFIMGYNIDFRLLNLWITCHLFIRPSISFPLVSGPLARSQPMSFWIPTLMFLSAPVALPRMQCHSSHIIHEKCEKWGSGQPWIACFMAQQSYHRLWFFWDLCSTPQHVDFFLRSYPDHFKTVLLTGCKAAAGADQFPMIPRSCPSKERDWFPEPFSKEQGTNFLRNPHISALTGLGLPTSEPAMYRRGGVICCPQWEGPNGVSHSPLKPFDQSPPIHSTQQPPDNVTHHLSSFNGMENSFQAGPLPELHLPVSSLESRLALWFALDQWCHVTSKGRSSKHFCICPNL